MNRDQPFPNQLFMTGSSPTNHENCSIFKVTKLRSNLGVLAVCAVLSDVAPSKLNFAYIIISKGESSKFKNQ